MTGGGTIKDRPYSYLIEDSSL